jgi:hypothetical protein
MIVEPKCKNHPGRPGIAHYGKSYEYSLCAECLDKRLQAHLTEPLDEHGRRMSKADEEAHETRV